MKAESIEQIREHLAKGGRVVNAEGESVWKVVGMVVPSQFDEKDWQLLPLEEKEPVPCPGCGRHEPYCDCPPGMYDKKAPEPVTVTSDKIEAAGRLVKFIREHSSGQCRILSIGSACECPLCDVGRLLEEKEPVDHGTQKGQEERFRDSQKERMQRIRTRLLHGQWPEMSDLMDWWEATTGERIEWGRRCVICDGQGRLKSNSGDKRPGYEYTGCPGCSNGYSVRPTWMGDVNG